MSKKLVRKAIEMIRQLAEEDEEEDDEDEYEDEYEDEVEEEVEDDEEDEEAGEEGEEASKDGESKYSKFWKSFGKNIKLGVIEDAPNREKLSKLLRFGSTYDPEGLVSLDDYLERMNDDQDTIFYLPGDSLEAVKKSPLLKKYE